MAERNAYEVLGVAAKGASAEDIAKISDETIAAAYRKLANKYHPDRNPGNASVRAKFEEVKTAYADLKTDQNHPKQREKYNKAHGLHVWPKRDVLRIPGNRPVVVVEPNRQVVERKKDQKPPANKKPDEAKKKPASTNKEPGKSIVKRIEEYPLVVAASNAIEKFREAGGQVTEFVKKGGPLVEVAKDIGVKSYALAKLAGNKIQEIQANRAAQARAQTKSQTPPPGNNGRGAGTNGPTPTPPPVPPTASPQPSPAPQPAPSPTPPPSSASSNGRWQPGYMPLRNSPFYVKPPNIWEGFKNVVGKHEETIGVVAGAGLVAAGWFEKLYAPVTGYKNQNLLTAILEASAVGVAGYVASKLITGAISREDKGAVIVKFAASTALIGGTLWAGHNIADIPSRHFVWRAEQIASGGSRALQNAQGYSDNQAAYDTDRPTLRPSRSASNEQAPK